MFIWVAVDLDDEKVICVWVSFGRSGLEAMAFLKKVKHACKGKLPRIFIDVRSWYPWALERVGFERHTVISFGPRSAIKRLFGDIEKRIRQFWNGFIGRDLQLKGFIVLPISERGQMPFIHSCQARFRFITKINFWKYYFKSLINV